jgi:hypothetical protein
MRNAECRMRKLGRALIVALPLFLASCAACSSSPVQPDGPVDVRLVLAPGQATDIPAAAIRLRFVGVFGDSRCPADAICILGGDAIVRVEVTPSGAAPVPYDLHTGDGRPVRHGDLTIALENLSPYPFSNRTIAPSDYRATLRTTR